MLRTCLGYVVLFFLLVNFSACTKSKPMGKAVIKDIVQKNANSKQNQRKPGSKSISGLKDPTGAKTDGDKPGNESEQVEFPVEEFSLSNGLKVYFSRNDQSPEFYAEIIVRSGSKNEDPDATGLAHYLEHLMFKGTNKIGTKDYAKESAINQQIIAKYEEKKQAKSKEAKDKINAEIDRLSVEAAQYVITGDYDKLLTSMGQTHVNAHTSYEETVYHIALPSNRFDQWARIEKEVFTNPEIARTFQWELEVVYEEKNNRARPVSELFQKVRKKLFAGHGLGRSIIGETEHLKNPSIQKTIDFFKKHYVTGNMAIAIAGDLELSEVRATLEKTFGQLPAKAAPTYNAAALPELSGRVVEKYTFDVEPLIIAAFRLPGVNSKDHEALLVADSILANGNIGIIDTMNGERTIYKAGSGISFHTNHGLFYIHGGVKEDEKHKPLKSHEDVEKELLAIIEKLKKGEFSDELMNAVKVNFANTNSAINERNSSRVKNIRDSFINGQDWSHTIKFAERIQAVTREDVIRVANEYFSKGYVVGQMHRGPGKIESVEKPKITPIAGKTASGPSAEVKAIVAEEVAVIKPKFIEMNKMVTTAESSIAEYIVAENPMNDSETVQLEFNFGRYADGKVCSLVDYLAEAGTSKKKASEVKKEIYKMAMTGFKVDCGTEKTKISFTVLNSQLENAVKLVGELLSDPVLDKGYFNFLKSEGIKSLTESRKKADTAVAAVLAKFVLKDDSSYNFLLSKEEYLKMQAEDLKMATKKLLEYPVVVEYTGKKSVQEIQKLFEESIPFAKSKQTPVTRKNVSIEKVGKPTVYFYNVPNERQAKVRLLYPADKYTPGNFKNEVMDRIFSKYYAGGLSSVITSELREKRSLAYSPYAIYPFSTTYGGEIRSGDDQFFLGVIDTQSDKLQEALVAFQDLVKNMIWNKNGFESAKRSYKSQMGGAMGFRSLTAVYKIWKRLGYTSNPNIDRYKEIDGITMEMVAKRMAENVSQVQPTIIVVGDESRIDMKSISGEMEVIKLNKDELYPKM